MDESTRGELRHYIPDMTTDAPSGVVRGFAREELRRAGRRVMHYRRTHKLTQRAFAARAGVSVAAVQSLEAGTRQTRAESLDKIARALDLTRDQLLAPNPADFNRDPSTAIAAPTLDADALDFVVLYQHASDELQAAIKLALLEYHAEIEERRIRAVIGPSSSAAAAYARYRHELRNAYMHTLTRKHEGA